MIDKYRQTQLGTGYFGASAFDCATVSIQCSVNVIKLYLPAAEPTYLSLDGIEFYVNGSRVLLEPDSYQLEQSSVHQGRGPDRLLEQRRIHTERELAPFWLIRLRQPLYLDQVKLLNRRDRFASRNRTLHLHYETASGKTHVIEFNQHRPLRSVVREAWCQSSSVHIEDSLLQFVASEQKKFSELLDSADCYTGSKHFGANKQTAALFTLNCRVAEIELSLEDHTPQFLSLDGIAFIKDGEPCLLAPDSYQLSQSSLHKERGPECLLSMKRMHTLKELKPFWRINFNEPLRLDAIQVFNRGDTYSRRNLKLVCKVVTAEGDLFFLRLPSNNTLLKLMLMQLQCQDVSFARRLLAHGIQTGVVDIFALNWREILNYVDIWCETSALQLDEMIILAAYALVAKTHGQHKLKAFEARLRSAADIEQLEMSIGALSQTFGLGKYRLTKHGLIQANLVAESESYLAAINEFVSDAEALGYLAFISYGTLLGARRENAFLAHDDDVDMALVVNADDEASMKIELSRFMVALQKLGYKIKPVEKFPNVHVTKKGFKRLDVFPCWSVGQSTFMVMERMAIRPLPKDMIMPLSKIRFQQYEFPCPASPDDFLSERYGKNWQIPDKYHEWPWKLTQTSSTVNSQLDFLNVDAQALSDSLLASLQGFDFFRAGWLRHAHLLVIDCVFKHQRVAFDIHTKGNTEVMVCVFNRKNNLPVKLVANHKNVRRLSRNSCLVKSNSLSELVSVLSTILCQTLAAK